ncbi:MAG TPA: NAD-dependent epimerase/dehydratase family protein [Micromonosporaceae bacterium]|nr:NAD-dependent epimerase/dehydratase family protein [Micromonosporaceae bacterium]
MRLLILGGTAFLGRATAEAARAAGHEVTCAARGESGPPPEGVTFVRVDRDAPDGLAPLEESTFDAVVDVSSRPSQVRKAVAALAGSTGHWTYVSTGSVYADRVTPGQRAGSAPVLAAAPPEVDDPAADDYKAYGPCKVACEEAVRAGVGLDRGFICRAGLIVGPGDDSGRFAYWVDRLARGGEVLVPGRPSDPVQWVDVRDLAEWLVRAAQSGLTGGYDGIGPPVSRIDFLQAVSRGVAAESQRSRGVTVDPQWTWVDQDFLSEHGVQPWMGPRSLPMWLPLPDYGGFMTRDVSASLAAGLATRDVADTARDTLAWLGGVPLADRAGWPGLAAEDEAALLAAWHARPATADR